MKTRRNFILIVVGLLVVVSAWYHREQTALVRQCESNETDIGTAVLMFCVEHEGRYPASLQELSPSFLRVVPNCPASREPYVLKTMTPKESDWEEPRGFIIVCPGHARKDIGLRENYPQYHSSVRTIVEK